MSYQISVSLVPFFFLDSPLRRELREKYYAMHPIAQAMTKSALQCKLDRSMHGALNDLQDACLRAGVARPFLYVTAHTAIITLTESEFGKVQNEWHTLQKAVATRKPILEKCYARSLEELPEDMRAKMPGTDIFDDIYCRIELQDPPAASECWVHYVLHRNGTYEIEAYQCKAQKYDLGFWSVFRGDRSIANGFFTLNDTRPGWIFAPSTFPEDQITTEFWGRFDLESDCPELPRKAVHMILDALC